MVPKHKNGWEFHSACCSYINAKTKRIILSIVKCSYEVLPMMLLLIKREIATLYFHKEAWV